MDQNLFREAVDQSVKYIRIENERLKKKEEFLNRLLELLSVYEEQDPIHGSINVKITKLDMVRGRSWREIVELASQGDK